MCRWLAYTGDPVLPDELYKPKDSLIVQSLHSRLGAETTNGDGFGSAGTPPTPGFFHGVEPAWNDRNMRELAGPIGCSSSASGT
jgi:glutamine amidotransferase